MTRRRQKLGLILVSSLVALAGAEVALRIADYGEPGAELLRVGPDGLRPLVRSQTVAHPAQGVSYTYNARGFRGRDWTAPPGPDAKPRMAVLGDSFAFGTGVAEPDTLPVQLERALAGARRPVEVYNLGLPGTNTQQHVQVAERQLPELQPDAILLLVVDNDGEAMIRNPDPVATCGIELSSAERADRWLLEHAYVYRPLHAAISDDGCQGPRVCVARYGEDCPQTRCFGASLARLAALARRLDATLLAAFYPTIYVEWQDGEPHPNAAKVTAQLGPLMAEAGVPLLDLTPALSGSSVATLRTQADAHPNAEAHRLAAAALAQELIARWPGRLPPAPAVDAAASDD